MKRVAARLPQRTIERLLTYPILERRMAEVRRTPRFATREALWNDLWRRRAGEAVCCFEFGVWQGESLRALAQRSGSAQSRFYGFDSFQGLPEDWTAAHPKGTFDTGGRMPHVDDPRVQFVPGWFHASLPKFLAEHPDLVQSMQSGRLPLVVHVDSDLFSSALFVLSFLCSHFDTFDFLLDEFVGDECRALHYVSSAFGRRVEFYGHTLSPRRDGSYPLQVSGRLQAST